AADEAFVSIAGLGFVIHPRQRCDAPAGAQVNQLKAFCARPRVIVAIEQARLAIARCARCDAVEYLGCRADLLLMEVQKGALSEQRDSRKCKLRDRKQFYSSVGTANDCGFVREAVDQI